MSSEVFHKMSGSGNDFVMLDGRTTVVADWPADRIKKICDRRHGIGADGLVIVGQEAPGVVSMTYFNSDGSAAPMCGNAALCSTRLAAMLEMADPAGMKLVTGAGAFPTRCATASDLAELNLPDTDLPVTVPIALNEEEEAVHLGIVGVPHLVVRVADVAKVEIMSRGSELRHHPAAGAGGANTNFFSRASTSTGTGDLGVEPTWALRTFERGIEAETLSCGTGTVTAALALAAEGLDQLPLRFRSTSGTTLTVSAVIEGSRATQIWLCGPAVEVFTGVWLG